MSPDRVSAITHGAAIRERGEGHGVEWMLASLVRRRALDPRVLAARMRDAGYMISDSQAYRYVNAGPRRFLELLAAICRALDCGVADLILFAPEPRADASSQFDPPFRLPGT